MIAEFSVFPVGKGESLSQYVVECVKIVQLSGLAYELTPMGTIVQGDHDQVMTVISNCHKKVASMADRVVTNIKIDDRKDERPMRHKVESVKAAFPAKVAYHDSCSGLRELGVAKQPRKLLDSVEGVERVEMKDPDVCCGFGGAFAVKYGEISDAIVGVKADTIEDSGASVVLAGDLGCLMNMAGKLSRRGSKVEVRHVAEVLAGMTDAPAIGAAPKKIA